ncbi:MAG: apolipoprotein N-acyltransferase [Cohaesibacteraceae bacterium]|nr:apolipoprotein N-acyltransferase [Cohaesibacteraceae bacterium]
MHALVTSIHLSWGWQRRAMCFFAGVLTLLAQPPFGFMVLLWLSFPLLVWVMDSASFTRGISNRFFAGFGVGWWFGFGYFVPALYWLGNAFLVDAGRFAWAMPLAVLILPACLSLFWAIAFGIINLFWKPGVSRVFLSGLALGLAEWGRATMFTGFPWANPGLALVGTGVQMQILALTGAQILAFWLPLVFAIPVLIWAEKQRPPGSSGLLAFVVVLLCAQTGFGIYRLNLIEQTSENIVVRLVQGNIPQAEKWLPENRDTIFNKYLELTGSPAINASAKSRAIDYVIWPETSVPFLLTREPSGLTRIADALPGDAKLITGALRQQVLTTETATARLFNSIFLVANNGEVEAAYDKNHLVPFGEYLPFQNLLEDIGLQQLTQIKGGFETGTVRQLMGEENSRFLPLLCYEIIFPGEILSSLERPHWILNLTNDAWFGRTLGPYQHYFQARIRAVEMGLPVVRVANTGVSGVIDPYGDTIAKIALGKAGFLDVTVPDRLEETFYSQHAATIMLMNILLFLILSIGSQIIFGKPED